MLRLVLGTEQYRELGEAALSCTVACAIVFGPQAVLLMAVAADVASMVFMKPKSAGLATTLANMGTGSTYATPAMAATAAFRVGLNTLCDIEVRPPAVACPAETP